MTTDNIKEALFAYVKDPTKWFYWYHSPERLEALYDMDHCADKVKAANCNKHSEKLPDYKEDDFSFTKRVWRFKEKRIKNGTKPDIVIEENLAGFFDAVLDEVRLKKANAFAKYALYISDDEDLAYFRDRLAKREMSADIDYDSQRDHAIHTLYNYLFGWYIFEHSEKLREAFNKHLKDKLHIDPNKRNLGLGDFYKSSEFTTKCKIKIPTNNDISINLIHEFADVWFIASLLHDIGYILEGNLSSASPEVEHRRVTNGSKIIHDYFNHHFWKSFEVDFRVAKNIAKTLDVVVPDFKSSESLSSLGDRLCDIGSCENIRDNLLNKHGDESCQNDARDKTPTSYKSILSIQQDHGLNREAFSIWKEHYKRHGNKKMEDILYTVERVYKNMMWVGTDHGKRNLDHGVCSGLITLQALTFFHEIFCGFCRNEWLLESATPKVHFFNKKQDNSLKDDASNRVSEQLFKNIKTEITRVPKRIMVRGDFDSNGCADNNKHCKLGADFWFKKILWATAASAIHAIIQKDEYRKECKKHIDLDKEKSVKEHLKIGLDDDPLAFLGILVDGLQEWDRYKVSLRGEAAFSGTEPLQSIEVDIGLIDLDMIDYKESIEEKFSDTEISQSDKVTVDLIYSGMIYLTYPSGDKEKKDWIKDLEKLMNHCLEDDWKKIVKIVPDNDKAWHWLKAARRNS